MMMDDEAGWVEMGWRSSWWSTATEPGAGVCQARPGFMFSNNINLLEDLMRVRPAANVCCGMLCCPRPLR
jgi:hypothetical protein